MARLPIRLLRLFLTLALGAIAAIALRHFYFVPTTEALRVASLAASDEGYDVFQRGARLREMSSTGDNRIPGYTSVALFENGRATKSYAIRLATNDVVDLTDCKLLRYDNLVSYKRFKGTDKTEVSLNEVAAEVGCKNLDVVPGPAK